MKKKKKKHQEIGICCSRSLVIIPKTGCSFQALVGRVFLIISTNFLVNCRNLTPPILTPSAPVLEKRKKNRKGELKSNNESKKRETKRRLGFSIRNRGKLVNFSIFYSLNENKNHGIKHNFNS